MLQEPSSEQEALQPRRLPGEHAQLSAQIAFNEQISVWPFGQSAQLRAVSGE